MGAGGGVGEAFSMSTIDQDRFEAVKASAAMSADAHETVFYVVITRESEFYGAGGELRTARRGNEWRSWDGKYTTPLLAVLPFTYGM